MSATDCLHPRKPWLAALATFGAPGLGQLYNGQTRRSIIIYLLALAAFLIISLTPLGFSPLGILILVIVDVLIMIAVIVDAWIHAQKLRMYELRKYNRGYVYAGIAALHLLLVLPLMEYVFPKPTKAYRIPSSTMLPILQIDDHIVVDLTAYRSATPRRGDVVVFIYPDDPSKVMVKRVIGLPDETIEIKQKKVFINGRLLEKDWAIFEGTSSDVPGDNLLPTVVPADRYFMIGDNRDMSYDSRFFAPVSADKIKGKVLYIYWARDKSRIGTRIH